MPFPSSSLRAPPPLDVPALRAHPLIHTHSLDEAIAFQSRFSGPLKAEPSMRERFEWRASHFQVGSLTLIAASYRDGLRASGESGGTEYSIVLPTHGGGRMSVARCSATFAHGREGNVFSAEGAGAFEFGPAFSGMRAVFSPTVVASTLTMLTEHSPRGRVRFAPTVSLEAAREPSFVRHLRFVFSEVDRAPQLLRGTAVGAQLAETFLTMLLLTGEHDHRDLFERPVLPAEPLSNPAGGGVHSRAFSRADVAARARRRRWRQRPGAPRGLSPAPRLLANDIPSCASPRRREGSPRDGP